MNDEPPRPPRLDYLTPPPSTPRHPRLLGFAGFVVGVAAITFGGCGVFSAGGYPIAGGGPISTPTHWWAPVLFFTSVVASFVGAVLAYRAGSRPWFLMGVLIGAGLMSLVEGVCFFNS